VPLWLWPNVLSLDAPLIAVLWQDFLHRCYPATLLLAGRVALGLTVWAIYLADRLLDVRHPAKPGESTRHAFYRRHRSVALAALCAVVLGDVLVTCLWLRHAVISSGLIIAACVAAYLAFFPLKREIGGKKPAAAVLFTAGVFLIAWLGSTHPADELALPAILFCAMCFANLLMTQRWEQSEQARPAWILLVIILGLRGLVRGLPWFGAITVSAAGLGTLAWTGDRLSANAKGVLADAALLTPLLFR
jgi:drug/metabolite transporter (DMT)-like permease